MTAAADGAVAIDTNLLVLFVVGRTNLDYISKHRRTNGFSTDDFRKLTSALELRQRPLLLQHVLAETSNLLFSGIDDPIRAEIMTTFKSMILNAGEHVVTSRASVQRSEFVRLGLTDAALLEAGREGAVLLTMDERLQAAAGDAQYEVSYFKELPFKSTRRRAGL